MGGRCGGVGPIRIMYSCVGVWVPVSVSVSVWVVGVGVHTPDVSPRSLVSFTWSESPIHLVCFRQQAPEPLESLEPSEPCEPCEPATPPSLDQHQVICVLVACVREKKSYCAHCKIRATLGRLSLSLIVKKEVIA